jgi:phage host-nuclease inhibitor protein Gam
MTDFSIPETREEVNTAISEIGRRERERKLLDAAMNTQLAKIRARYEQIALPHKDAIDLLSLGVKIWCEANRDELTQDGKIKTVKLASGKVSWRLRPSKVAVSLRVDEILVILKRLKLTRFIRVTEDLNKTAMLAEPKAIARIEGLRIERGTEDFVIAPFETGLEG